MTAQQIDYSFIAIASSALGKSLRKGISLKTVFAFNDAASDDHVMISLYNDLDFKCIKPFFQFRLSRQFCNALCGS